METHEHQKGRSEPWREAEKLQKGKDDLFLWINDTTNKPSVNVRICVLPVCALCMYGHRLAAKVLAPVEMPHHRDLPQHHPALWHREATRRSEQVWAASRPGEVTVLDPDGTLGQHRHYGLPVSGLQGHTCCQRKFELTGKKEANKKDSRSTRARWHSQVCPCQEPPGCRNHHCRWSPLSLHPISYQPEPLLSNSVTKVPFH